MVLQKKVKTPAKMEMEAQQKSRFVVDEDEKDLGEEDESDENMDDDVEEDIKKPTTELLFTINKKKLIPKAKPEKKIMERNRERDLKTLYVRDLPVDITIEEIKSLSADIINVTLPLQNKNSKKKKPKYAFLEFASEQKAIENNVTLQGKKLKGRTIYVDFCGEKSHTFKSKISVVEDKPDNLVLYNKKRLHFIGLPIDTKIDDFAKSCPTALSIALNVSDLNRTADAIFENEEDAAAALNAIKSGKLPGKHAAVTYAVIKRKAAKRKTPYIEPKAPTPSKKRKRKASSSQKI